MCFILRDVVSLKNTYDLALGLDALYVLGLTHSVVLSFSYSLYTQLTPSVGIEGTLLLSARVNKD